MPHLPQPTSALRQVLRTLVPTTLCVVAGLTADPVTPQGNEPSKSAVEFVSPDLGRLLKRVENGPWGRTWNDKALEELRTSATTGMTKAATFLGFDPLTAMRNSKDLVLTLDKLANLERDPVVEGHLQIAAKDAVAPIIALMTKEKRSRLSELTVAGFTNAFAWQPDRKAPIFHVGVNGPHVVVAAAKNGLSVRNVPSSDTDVRVVIRQEELNRLIAVASNNPDSIKPFQRFAAANPELVKDSVWTSTAIPEGFLDRISGPPMVGHKMADRRLLNRLPANTLMSLIVGVDGKKVWEVYGGLMLDSIVSGLNDVGMSLTSEAALKQADGFLEQMGLGLTVKELIAGVNGTVLIAVTPSAPAPAVTIVLPRSPEIDKLIGWTLTQMGQEVPKEGQPTAIPLPNVPMITPFLVGDAKTWCITTDNLIANSWASGEAGGFATAPSYLTAVKNAPADAVMLGTSDTPAVIRTIASYTSVIPMPAKDKRTLANVLNKFSANVSTGYVWARSGTDEGVTEMRGIFGGAALPVIATVMAYPIAYEEARRQERGGGGGGGGGGGAVKARAAVLLKSGMFPAQIQFQAGGYRDVDKDGRGEYGLVEHMGGFTDPVNGPTKALSLMQPEFSVPRPVVDGYQYTVFIPTGDLSGSFDSAVIAKAAQKPEVCDLQETFWVCYAMPTGADQTLPCYAITANGSVYQSVPQVIGNLTWNSLFGDKGWGTAVDEGLWQPVK